LSSKRFLTHVFPVLMLLPALLPLVLFILLPAIRTIQMSFYRVTFGQPDQFVGIMNYVETFKDEIFKTALSNTLIFSFSVVAGEVLFGLAAAVLVSTGFRAQRVIIALIMVPYAVSEVVAAIIWKYMLDPDVGIVNFVVHTLGGLPQIQWASHPAQAWIVVILMRVWINFPFSFLIIYASIIGIAQELYESAYIDGASNWQAFRAITLPLSTPAIMVATIFAFVFAFRDFATVWIMTRGGPMNRTELLSTLLYKQGFTFWEFGMASAVAVVMTIFTFVIASFYLRDMYKQMFLKRQ
jgi:multiple sugar transport system permease protein